MNRRIVSGNGASRNIIFTKGVSLPKHLMDSGQTLNSMKLGKRVEIEVNTIHIMGDHLSGLCIFALTSFS